MILFCRFGLQFTLIYQEAMCGLPYQQLDNFNMFSLVIKSAFQGTRFPTGL
jgi:hypothetical protein